MEHLKQWMALLHTLIQGPGYFLCKTLPSSTRGFQDWKGKEYEEHCRRFDGTGLEAAYITLVYIPLARAGSNGHIQLQGGWEI